jgi:hypothetical protein
MASGDLEIFGSSSKKTQIHVGLMGFVTTVTSSEAVRPA